MDFTLALATVSSTLEIVKKVRDIEKDFDAAVLKSQMAEVYGNLADVKMALTDAKQEIYERDQKIRELEQKLVDATSGDLCPICKSGRLQVKAIDKHPHLGEVGIQEKTIGCDNPECSHTEKQMHDPAGFLDKG